MRVNKSRTGSCRLLTWVLALGWLGWTLPSFAQEAPEPRPTVTEQPPLEPPPQGEQAADAAPTQAQPVPGEVPQAAPPPDIDPELQGKRIGRVDFSCDLPTCRNPLSIEAFLEIMGLYIGQQYSTEALRRAERRLAKTGFFDKLTVEKRLVGNAVFLDVHGNGATLIRKVLFEGVEAPPFESELRKLLSYRRGQAYRDDPEKATAQLESLEALYEREGYFGTEIAMITKAVPNRTHEVDLVFRINKGNRRRICDVALRGVKAMTYAEARDHLLSDFSFLPRRLNLFPLYYTARGFKNGQQNLVQEYRKQGHFQARIVEKATTTDQETGCVVLAVDLFEGPHWDIRFKGSELFSDGDLLEQLPFFESGYVDKEEIRRAERAIETLYETRGYPFAEVRGVEIRRDRLDRAVEFTIDEGPQLEIAEIEFHGNEHISREVLDEVLQTQPYGLFETGGYLQTDQLLGDFGRIEELYRERGYLRALVERFAVEILDDRDALRIHVYIDEGAPTLVERAEVDGNRVLTDQALLRGLSGVKGQPFVPLQLKGDLTKLLQKYSQLGYPMTRIVTTCRLLSGQIVPCEAPRMPRGCVARSLEELTDRCSWDDGHRQFVCQRRNPAAQCVFEAGVSADRVAIRHTVTEGPRVQIGNILLKGNFATDRSVIFREVPFEQGDLLDTQRVIEGQGNLRSLNLFDSVSIETIGLDEDVRDADETVTALLVSVEEGRTRDIDLSVGIELRDVLSDQRQFLVTGEAEYSDRNLFGRGFGVNPRLISAVDTLDVARVAAGVADELQTASEIRTVDYVIGTEIIFSHPRFLKSALGIDKLFATLSPFYIIDLVGVINRQVLREEGGVRVELRKELTEILKRLFLKFGVEVKSIASFAPGGPVVDGERVFSPRRTIGKITPDLALDRRNSPLNPTKGFIARLEPALVSGDALGRGRERFIEDSFVRMTASLSVYLPLWKEFVLGNAIRAGQIFPLFARETPIQADELYFLGGVSSVRGFPDGNLGPLGAATQRPSGGEFMLNYNAELRYPILPQYDIYGATFFDAGLLADCRSDVFAGRDCYRDAFAGNAFESVRTAAGIGLRAVFFDQIPVVLDYALVLNRIPGEKFGQVHFNVGYTFD